MVLFKIFGMNFNLNILSPKNVATFFKHFLFNDNILVPKTFLALLVFWIGHLFKLRINSVCQWGPLYLCPLYSSPAPSIFSFIWNQFFASLLKLFEKHSDKICQWIYLIGIRSLTYASGISNLVVEVFLHHIITNISHILLEV